MRMHSPTLSVPSRQHRTSATSWFLVLIAHYTLQSLTIIINVMKSQFLCAILLPEIIISHKTLHSKAVLTRAIAACSVQYGEFKCITTVHHLDLLCSYHVERVCLWNNYTQLDNWIVSCAHTNITASQLGQPSQWDCFHKVFQFHFLQWCVQWITTHSPILESIFGEDPIHYSWSRPNQSPLDLAPGC